jgi:drug/metabolite transporter (DMT)-like permease
MAGTLRQVTTRSMHLQVIRNVSHFTGQNLWFWALTMIPLAQLFAVEFTSPLWVAVLAPLLLGERLTRVRALAAVMGFAGVLIVARPDFANVNLGLLGAAGAAIGFAGSAIFTKLLMRTETITCILFWLVVLQAIFALVISGADGHITWPAATSWPWLAVVGAAGLIAHFCLTRALSLAPAVVVIPFDFARLPVIVIIGDGALRRTAAALRAAGRRGDPAGELDQHPGRGSPRRRPARAAMTGTTHPARHVTFR